MSIHTRSYWQSNGCSKLVVCILIQVIKLSIRFNARQVSEQYSITKVGSSLLQLMMFCLLQAMIQSESDSHIKGSVSFNRSNPVDPIEIHTMLISTGYLLRFIQIYYTYTPLTDRQTAQAQQQGSVRVQNLKTGNYSSKDSGKSHPCFPERSLNWLYLIFLRRSMVASNNLTLRLRKPYLYFLGKTVV